MEHQPIYQVQSFYFIDPRDFAFVELKADAGRCDEMKLVLAARDVRFRLATDRVALNGDALDGALIDQFHELAEGDLIACAFRRLEETPEKEDENDDHHPEQCGFYGGIQRICLQNDTSMLDTCRSYSNAFS